MLYGDMSADDMSADAQLAEVALDALNDVLSTPLSSSVEAAQKAVKQAKEEAKFYRHVLGVIAETEGSGLASLALACPREGQEAHDTYLQQQKRVVDLTQEYLNGPREDAGRLEKEMDKLLRMRGMGSRPATPVKDARGSRRKR